MSALGPYRCRWEAVPAELAQNTSSRLSGEEERAGGPKYRAAEFGSAIHRRTSRDPRASIAKNRLLPGASQDPGEISKATELLGTGVPLQHVQGAMGHADPRTTRRYDRSRHNLDRHPTYQMATQLHRTSGPPPE